MRSAIKDPRSSSLQSDQSDTVTYMKEGGTLLAGSKLVVEKSLWLQTCLSVERSLVKCRPSHSKRVRLLSQQHIEIVSSFYNGRVRKRVTLLLCLSSLHGNLYLDSS